jgi:hypothetical protein
MSPEWVAEISKRYIELYEQVTGMSFVPSDYATEVKKTELAIVDFLSNLLGQTRV